MAVTTPKGEQIQFVSSKTGTHNLDTYLEAAEVGNRQLSDLIDDLFDSSTGVFKSDNFEFRFNATDDKIQVRIGQFATSSAGWTDVTTFFSIEGAFSTSTSYNNFDIVTVTNGDGYIVHGLASAQTFGSESAFTSSSNTYKLIDVSGAQDWATKTSAAVSGSDYSAKEYAQGTQASTGGSAKSWAQDADQVNGASTNDRSAKAWAQGASMTGSTLGGSAKDWAQHTGSTVDGTNYSAKHWATQADVGTVASGISNINTTAGGITNINTVAGNISNVNTVAGISSNITTVAGKASLITSDFVTDLNLVTSDFITDLNLVTADFITDMNLVTADFITDLNLVTADFISDMNLVTSDFVSDMSLVTADFVSDVNTLAVSSVITDMDILATSANVTAMGLLGTSTNVTNMATVATNITNVNSFANTYAIAGSAPASPTEGDLWYDTGNDKMKVYNGSAWVNFIAGENSDALSEGSNNKYYTDTRVETYLSGQSATPDFASGVSQGNWKVLGHLQGPAVFTIDPAALGDNTGKVVIAGDLQVDGTQTTVNSTTMSVADLNITVANGAGNAAAANGAGLTVGGASATLTYANADDTWNFNKTVKINSSAVATVDESVANAIALG